MHHGLYNLKAVRHVVYTLLALLAAIAVGAFTSTSSFHVGTSVNNKVSTSNTEMKSKDNIAIMHHDDERERDSLELQPIFINRRKALLQSTAYLSSSFIKHPSNAQANDDEPTTTISRGKVFEIDDPNTYSGVVYIPPAIKEQQREVSYPLLVVLHGAGNNQHSALYEFTQSAADSSTTPPGDHINLPPYLLSTNQAPSSLSDNFVVVAPYVGRGKRSLYDEPRSKILSFIKWFNAWLESQTMVDGTVSITINRQRVSLFGFSEGSTLAVELATTRNFLGVVLCSYGFTGILPKMAIERLQGIPIWVFHSKDDDVYDIQCSNQLVESLLTYEGAVDVFGTGDIIKYTKLLPQQQNNNSGKGNNGYEHVRAALVASKNKEVYEWLLSLK